MTSRTWIMPDIPKPGTPTEGDRTKETLHQAMGEAISAWADLEAQVAGLFHFFVSIDQAGAIALGAYGTIDSFYNQLQMMKGAAHVFFQRAGDVTHQWPDDSKTSYQKELITFANRCQKLSEIRNNIVHGRIDIDPSIGGREIEGYCLVPHVYDKKNKNGPEYVYSSKELKLFATAFEFRPALLNTIFRYAFEKQKAWREKPPR
jgi:hypothetical protein